MFVIPSDSEGPWCSPTAAPPLRQARTKIPSTPLRAGSRFARDDNPFSHSLILASLRMTVPLESKLSAQALHQSAKGFFVAAIPAPLALLDHLDQAGLGENGHVMRDGGLGEAHTLFDVAGAEPRVLGDRGRACGRRAALFESPQDAAARGIGNGVQRAVERCGRSHGD